MVAPGPLTAPASAAAQKVLDKELSFSRHVEIWFKEWVEGRKLRSAKDIRRVIDTDLKPWFKDKPINKISRDDINEMIKHLGSVSRRRQPRLQVAKLFLQLCLRQEEQASSAIADD